MKGLVVDGTTSAYGDGMYDMTLNEWFRHLAVCGVLRREERRARGIRIAPGPMLKRPLNPKNNLRRR